ncbi:MAG: hypothetical protein JNM75_08080 [Rhodospirillales bacterium]|nr:hypothetical protein [Rhodospirillales bacterium]
MAPPVLTAPKVYEGKCPEEAGGPGTVIYTGDVLIKLPTNRVCGGSIIVARARNVRITGGSIVYNGSNKEAVITIKDSSGTALIDGLSIDVNDKFSDAIRAVRNTGRLIVQNTRISGVTGQPSGPHGDITHAQGGGPLSELTLQNVSAYTGYQGLFTPYRPTEGHGTHKLTLDRVNFGYDPNIPSSSKPLMLLFMGSATDATNRPPDRGTTLSNVYVDVSLWQNQLRGFAYNKAIYAGPTVQGDGCASFAAANKISGRACGGRPPAGDFAPKERVGLAYNRAYFCTN